MEEVVPLNTVEVVDPDVRSHVYSLVTALGGFNGADADQYVLGDDALACLRDIKRWLKLYDEKFNRMDVARCLGEANLVNGDLIQILSLWWNGNQQSKYMSRIALACVELLVPLTWPLEIHGEMTVNHHRHIPYLQQAQVSYKRGILNNGSCGLRAVIRIGLPSMATPRSERTTRDEGILKIMLYLLRNIAIISANARLAAEGEEEETSRSATINAFHDQDVFALLLTLCSNVSDDFNMLDIALLETLFHIVKGVNVEKLFMNDAQRSAKRTDELNDLLQQESSLRREYAKNAPTRHGRFGTMIWVKRDDAKVSTVSGQDVLKDGQKTLDKMDQTKKWNRPRRARKGQDMTLDNDFNTPAHLNQRASTNLRMFVEEFLDSGFNPLFVHVRKAIERESVRVLPINKRHFLYTVSWFLEAERVRRARQREKRAQTERPGKELEPDSFGLVASVFNQEMFVFLNRSMQYSLDNKEWEDLNAAMRCFTQILLTVQEMAQSPLDEDQEIADNIQNRIFYEETTHDRILTITRGYTDQGFGYLDACTELSHVFLRMLERYSKENVDLHVRSQRRARKKKRDEQPSNDGDDNDEDQKSEDEDYAEAERMSKERKFDFTRFAAKFCNQKCVDTFVSFTKFYKELNTEQLKRAHRYFYRIAFKQEMTVLLYRVDILNLFYRMIKGPGGIESSKPIFREWEELVRQLVRRLLKKLDQRPALITELLFSKINSTAFYLEYGYEKQTVSISKRAPAELEVDPKAASTLEDKLSIVVAALVKDEQTTLAKWISDVVGSAADEREAWEAQQAAQVDEGEERPNVSNPIIAVKPRDESCKRAMFSNAKLRLLMTLVGFERLGQENVEGISWVIPSSSSSPELRALKSTIDKALVIGATDERDPRDLLCRKYGNQPRGVAEQATLDVNFGSDSEGEDIVPDGPLFPPNPRSKSNALDELKKKRKKRKDNGEADPLDEETLEERRKARDENARARLAKIKSDLFVHASDEETDDEADQEFFRLEEERRKEQSERIKEALLLGRTEAPSDTSKKKKRGKRANETTAGEAEAGGKRRRRSFATPELNDDDDVLMGDLGTPSRASSVGDLSIDANGVDKDALTSPSDDELEIDDLGFGQGREKTLELRPSDYTSDPKGDATNEEYEDDAPVSAPARRRIRAGFVIDSDSE
ncbi:topoisomerase 1-associated factor 1 [Aspergillus insuetus]